MIDTLGIFSGQVLNVEPGCSAYPLSQFSHSETFVFLSQIGGCACLPSYLLSLAQDASPARRRTIIVDTSCRASDNGPDTSITSTLFIPAGVTLRGGGFYAQEMCFAGLVNVPAVVFSSTSAYAGIRDLVICGPVRGPGNTPTMGVYMSSCPGPIFMQNVRILTFPRGIYAFNSNNVFLDHVQIVGGERQWNAAEPDVEFSTPEQDKMTVGVESVLGSTWRIANSFIRDTSRWAINIASTSDVVIDGGRYESNGTSSILPVVARGAIQSSGRKVLIYGNYIEANGLRTVPEFRVGIAVRMTSVSRGTRIIGNYLSGDSIAFLDRVLAKSNPPIPASNPIMTIQDMSSMLQNGHMIAFNANADNGQFTYPERYMFVPEFVAANAEGGEGLV